MRDLPVRLKGLRPLGCDTWRMELEGRLPEYQPGQFALLSTGRPDLMLPRPFGISAQSENGVEILFRVVGEGTRHFTTLDPGTTLTLRGPAGTPFAPPKGRTLALAGTLGAAPLLLWRQKYGPFARFALGVPNVAWQQYADHLKARIPELEFFTDDGSAGRKGSCLEALKDGGYDEIVACGPNGMLKALAKLKAPEILWQVSMEKRMGCGFGGCHGCVVPLKQGLKRLCVDGPVVDGDEVVWDELA